MIERFNFSKGAPSWVKYEHTARYNFAAKYVDGKFVVDAACGTGQGSFLFAKSNAKFVNAYDLEELSINEAKSKLISENLSFNVADCLKLPLDDGCADIYISLETIEHINEDKVFLDEVKRVLKRGGIFICSTPNRTITNPGTTIEQKPRNPFHVREYNKEDFNALLQSKFESVELFGLNKKSSFAVFIIRLACKILPHFISVRIPMLFKIPKLFFDKQDNHIVTPLIGSHEYEYLVAVCKV